MSAADIADFLDLMPLTVTVATLTARSSYGVATYGTAVSYRARVTYKTHYVRGPDGELKAARGIIWFAASVAIAPDAKITLPDGSAPDILSVAQVTDESGEILYTRVDFG